MNPDHLERLLDQDDERRDARCSKCHNVDASKVVERLIASEHRLGLAEAELRRRVTLEELHLAGNPEVAALMAENAELRQTIERQNARILRRRSA